MVFKLPKPEAVILLYEWTVALKGFVDFIIVESGGVHLLRVDEEKGSLKEVKCFASRISCCWFDPGNEILATNRVD
jgi:hypothetical protein